MERTGFIHVLISIFTAIGSLFTGGSGAPKQVVEPAAQVAVLSLDVRSHGATNQELDAAIAALEARFPAAQVTLQDAVPGTKRRIVIDGAQDSGDASLTGLATKPGGFRLLMMATQEDALELSVDLADEKARAVDFLAASELLTIDDYNRLTPEGGGSPNRLVFAMPPQEAGSGPVALCSELQEKWQFDQDAMTRFFPTHDRGGYPVVGFEVAPDRQDDFEAFTKHHEGEQMAILVGSEIATMPYISSPLRAGGIITSGSSSFSQQAVAALCSLLSGPKLAIQLSLRSIERRDP